MKKTILAAVFICLIFVLCAGCVSDEDYAEIEELIAGVNKMNDTLAAAVGISAADAEPTVGSEFAVAVITGGGDIAESSSEQLIYETCRDFCQIQAMGFRYYKPDSDTDEARTAAVEAAIENGYNVIVVSGRGFAGVLGNAGDYPDITFIALDVSADDIENGYEPPENLRLASFREELGGYMAGYAAVLSGYRHIGFLGCTETPDIIRYGYGFIQGADDASEDLGINTVEIKYVYANEKTGDVSVTERMESWYEDGTQAVFVCGGDMYLYASEAAAEYEGKIIGADTDKAAVIDSAFGGEITLTSAVKDYAAVIESALGSIADGTFAGGDDTFGLVSESPETNYVRLADSTLFSDSFTEKNYDALVTSLYNGELSVSKNTDSCPTVRNITVEYQEDIK